MNHAGISSAFGSRGKCHPAADIDIDRRQYGNVYCLRIVIDIVDCYGSAAGRTVVRTMVELVMLTVKTSNTVGVSLTIPW